MLKPSLNILHVLMYINKTNAILLFALLLQLLHVYGLHAQLHLQRGVIVTTGSKSQMVTSSYRHATIFNSAG